MSAQKPNEANAYNGSDPEKGAISEVEKVKKHAEIIIGASGEGKKKGRRGLNPAFLFYKKRGPDPMASHGIRPQQRGLFYNFGHD